MFAHENMLRELVPIVVETLGDAYPEMSKKQQAVIELIAHEQEVYKTLRENSSKAFAKVLTEFPKLDDIDLMECPGFVPAYREFKEQRLNFSNNTIPGDFLYKLTDTYGLTEESFLKLAELENMNCDLHRYRAELALAKLRAKEPQRNDFDVNIQKRIYEAQLDISKRMPPTDNSYKYVYKYDKESETYATPTLKTHVLGLLSNDAEVSHIFGSRLQKTDTISIITEASNFYYESGGQQSDLGTLLVGNKHKPDETHKLNVLGIKYLNDCVVHICSLNALTEDFELAIGDEVHLKVDNETRQLTTVHHSGML